MGDFLAMRHFHNLMKMLMQNVTNKCMHNAKGSEILVPKHFPKRFHSLIQKLDYIPGLIALVETKYLTWTKRSQV